MSTARDQHTATLLPDGRMLVVGGDGGLRSAEVYNPTTNMWSSAGSLHIMKAAHTATLLLDGRVLVVGKSNSGVSNVDLYNPATNAWISAGNLSAPRYHHTATLLSDGRVLVVGGENSGGTLNSAEIYNPATNVWSSASNLSIAHYWHTATILSNGSVLVVGGDNSGGALNSAEVYDSTTNTWNSAGSLSTARYHHTATLLPDGRVLVVGGENSGGALNSAEIYNPATNTWSNAGNLSTARSAHTATLLPDGHLLVVGGFSSGSLSSAEVYDPATNTWSSTGNLSTARGRHTATLLADGRVFVLGGYNNGYLSSTEVYTPTINTWSGAGSLHITRYAHTATLLPDGHVLIIGGEDSGGALNSAEVYDSTTNTWNSAGSLSTARYHHTATLLPDGRVLVVGGENSGGALNSAEMYNPATNTWNSAGSLATSHKQHTATLLADGRVLVVGGSFVNSPEVYTPITNTWSSAGSLATIRSMHTATLLADGRVLVVGGSNIGALNSAEAYNPTTNTWSSAGSLSTARARHTATLLPDGRVLVVGGDNIDGDLSDTEMYEPTTNTWSRAGNLFTKRHNHTTTLLADGRVLVVGGFSNTVNYVSSAEVYDLATDAWSSAGSLSTARSMHTATLLADGRVLVAGGLRSMSLSSVELYANNTTTLLTSRPQITSITPRLNLGGIIQIQGDGLRGILDGHAEGSSGSTNSSSTNFSVLRLYSLTSGQIRYLSSDSLIGTSSTSFTSVPVTNFSSGYAIASIIANGVPSAAQIISINFVPKISAVPNQHIINTENTLLGPLSVAISDTENQASALIVTATSSNISLVPTNNVVVSGTGDIRTLTIAPIVNQTGTTTITLTVQDSDGARTSTSFAVTALPPGPTWLALLYLAGDDIVTGTNQESLTSSITALINDPHRIPYNPAVRTVILYDGNKIGDSQIYVREPIGLRALSPDQLWPGYPVNNELDTGSPATLRAFISWAQATYPAQHTFLSIVDHGGGWAPDFADPPGQPHGKPRVQAGGWRGMSMDVTNGNSLSTHGTGQALDSVGHIDVLFFDACLMGMAESAYEVRNAADYFVAGENLLFAELPYQDYLDPSQLTSATTPHDLALRIVDRYNPTPDTAKYPFTIAAIDLHQLRSDIPNNMATRVNTLAERLLAVLPDPVPVDNALQTALRTLYAQTQKFDYDNSSTIDSTDGYVDLVDFARKLRDSTDPAIPDDVKQAAAAVVDAVQGNSSTGISPIVLQQRGSSGTYNGHPWNFSGATGLSIYLPLGEQDNRPTRVDSEHPDQPAQPERQLTYYSDSSQLTWTRDVPQWANLLIRLEPNTPLRDQAQRPFLSPSQPRGFQGAFLPLLMSR